MKSKTIQAIYENGLLKLQGKLPLRERAKVRLIFDWPSSTARRTRGLLRLPPRIAKLVVESDEFSVLNS
jgi:predicted DNA-binding antitoxin AbrB/MazE fold protein